MDAPDLKADCSRCFGLCCVLLPFSAASGFGIDKPGGTPCPNLAADDRCTIHETLREDGWPGCTVYDCFGAGQQVSQVTYDGVSWREHDNLGEMAAVLSVMRQLHEMLAHLEEVARRAPAESAAAAYDRVVALTTGGPEELLRLDVDGLRAAVGDELRAASARLRGHGPGRRPHLEGRDLAGRDLRTVDLRRADLRGALLIRADLRGGDLSDADLLGADLRDADARGADLSGALFLNQAQANSLVGDAATHLPDRLSRPGHWT